MQDDIAVPVPGDSAGDQSPNSSERCLCGAKRKEHLRTEIGALYCPRSYGLFTPAPSVDRAMHHGEELPGGA